MTHKPTFETVLPRRQFVATGAAAALRRALPAAGAASAGRVRRRPLPARPHLPRARPLRRAPTGPRWPSGVPSRR